MELGAPLLGQQYVASALLASGCDVRIVDGCARNLAYRAADVLAIASEWQPDIIGVALFTRWVYHAYELAEQLSGHAQWLIAGGPHVRACPTEPLAHGFNAVLVGEVERSVAQFVKFADGRCDAAHVPGLILRDKQGKLHFGSPSKTIEDLDALPLPLLAQDLFDSRWYDTGSKTVIPGGVLTSRGCPSRCTFCANYVTGRRFRHRSAESVIDELETLHRRYDLSFFPFWDDAFTVNTQRVLELCRCFEKKLSFPIQWHAITRASHVRPDLLRAMKRSGCASINFGVESGDDGVLRAIRKGVTTAQVEQALEWAKTEEMITVCNFMMGFPQETTREIENTRRFMERIAPYVDAFSTLGVVVPFPGTPIYADFHLQYGFTNWWLKPEYARYPAAREACGAEYHNREYIEDANLDLDFFHCSCEHQALMRECLRFKAEHNTRMLRAPGDSFAQPGIAAATSS